MTLADRDRERYAAQLALPGWGAEGQERLRTASACVVGAGSVGALAAAHLAGAGVGRIGLVDGGRVELRGLARQTLHFEPEEGARRAESVAAKLGPIGPGVLVEPYPVPLEAGNAEAILAGADVVVECSGSDATRRLVNRACCSLGSQLVLEWAAPLRVAVLSVRPGASACYRCVRPEDGKQGDRTEGSPAALAALGGLTASVQALEALKLLVGIGEPLLDRILWIDAGSMDAGLEPVARRAGCLACGHAGAPQQSPP